MICCKATFSKFRTCFMVCKRWVLIPKFIKCSIVVITRVFLSKVTVLNIFTKFYFTTNWFKDTKKCFKKCRFTKTIYTTDSNFFTTFNVEIKWFCKWFIITNYKVTSFNKETARCFREFKVER